MCCTPTVLLLMTYLYRIWIYYRFPIPTILILIFVWCFTYNFTICIVSCPSVGWDWTICYAANMHCCKKCCNCYLLLIFSSFSQISSNIQPCYSWLPIYTSNTNGGSVPARRLLLNAPTPTPCADTMQPGKYLDESSAQSPANIMDTDMPRIHIICPHLTY